MLRCASGYYVLQYGCWERNLQGWIDTTNFSAGKKGKWCPLWPPRTSCGDLDEMWGGRLIKKENWVRLSGKLHWFQSSVWRFHMYFRYFDWPLGGTRVKPNWNNFNTATDKNKRLGACTLSLCVSLLWVEFFNIGMSQLLQSSEMLERHIEEF